MKETERTNPLAELASRVEDLADWNEGETYRLEIRLTVPSWGYRVVYDGPKATNVMAHGVTAQECLAELDGRDLWMTTADAAAQVRFSEAGRLPHARTLLHHFRLTREEFVGCSYHALEEYLLEQLEDERELLDEPKRTWQDTLGNTLVNEGF